MVYLIVNKILRIVIADYGTYHAIFDFIGQPQYVVELQNNKSSQLPSKIPPLFIKYLTNLNPGVTINGQ